jgi:nitroimidazol reductase NimA-like FMN-containing flavoprotein (pyridoxamine 5'-phosphate oxidase superfamily)
MTRSTLRTEPMSDEAMDALLARSRMGRMAFLDGRRIEIRPLGFVKDGDWVFGRMGDGGKLDALLRAPWVAFQVDEVTSPWVWESVLLRGPVHFLPPGEGGPEGVRLRERALRALEDAIPGFGTPEDPGAHRGHLFGILPQERSGMRGARVETP